MKKFFALILVLCFVLGLSATAWAAEITIDSVTPGTTVTSADTIEISGSIPVQYDDGATMYTYRLTRDGSNVTANTSGAFTVSIKASALKDNQVVFELYETATDMENTEAYQESLADTETISFTVVTKPSMSAGNLKITCDGGHSVTQATLSGTNFTFNLPVACIKGNHKLTVATTGITSDVNVVISPSDTINAATITSSNNTVITLENIAGEAKYNLKVNLPSDNAGLKSVTLTSGDWSKSVTSGFSSGEPTAISVDASVSSAISVSAVASASGATVSTPSNFTLSKQGDSATFSVTVTAPDETTKATYNFKATRATGAVSLISSGNLRITSASGSSVATLGALTSSSSTPTLSIPAANRSNTTFYLTLSLPSNATLSSSATFGGSSSNVSVNTSTKVATLTMPSATTSRELVLNVSVGSSSYPVKINVTRVTNAQILKSVTLTGSGSTKLGSLSTISGTGTHTLNINTTTASANLTWEVADGATVTSVKWDGTTKSSGASVSLPAAGKTLQLIITATASDNKSYTATITVSNSATTSGTLSNLYVKRSVTTSTTNSNLFDTDPSSFSSSTTRYTVYVDSDTDSIYIYPVKNNSNDKIEVSGTYSKMVDRSSSGYYQIDLRSGTNTVKIAVTASGSSSVTTTYTLDIETEEDVVRNASLDSLYISKSSTSTTSSNRYSMTPSFAYNKLKYEVDLAKSVTEVYLHFTTHHDNADVSVSGATKVSEGIYKATLTTNKTKTVTITVDYKNDDTKYTVNLNNGSAGNRYALLDNLRVASRESISSSYQYKLLPSFDAAIKDYVALIPYDSSESYAYVQATLENDDDTLTVDGDSTDDGDWVRFSINRNRSVSVPIKVKDDDGNTSTYNLNLVAAPKNANDDATLSALSLRTGSSTSTAVGFDTTFNKTTYSYTANNVANNVESIRVYFTPNDSAAWVLVDNVLVEDDYATVDLSEGNNSIKVLVYAEDCETSKTYTITVNRGALGGSDSTLSNLEVRYGSATGQTLSLIPAFSKTITGYRVNVADTVTQISFRPTATEESAVIRIMGATEKSGEWTSYNALNNSTNNYLITVTSGDGKSVTSYLVEVVRGLTVVVSPQKLSVNGVDVTCAAYNINGNNYFKLRDIAYALRGTPKNFDVTYNSATRVISMISGRAYSIIGGEMVRPTAALKCILSNQSVLLDGLSQALTAYNVDGNNYFMLREIGALFDFGVDYNDATATVLVDTSKKYTP